MFRHLPAAFPELNGYYITLQVVTLLAYMALCRIKTVEQLQYKDPGELGKLMGLDRVLAVRPLPHLPRRGAAKAWCPRLQPWVGAVQT